MLLTLIKTLIALQTGLSPSDRYPQDYGPSLKNGDEFDFIVVGAGSAGSLLANRLTQISQWKVLVLEAGGYPSGMSEIPGLAFSLQESHEDWNYKTEPSETYCLGLEDRVCKFPRGKCLGGSSTINVMLYARSTKYDHDKWVEAGNDGWDHDSVVKYYKKFENAHVTNNKYYGTDGELHVTPYTSSQPVRQIFEEAYQELGYSEYTEDNPIGFRDLLMSIYEGTRQNAAKAFIAPVRNRKNLYVAINAHVSRVLIDAKKLTAFGVEVKIQDQIFKLKAKKEVILSAGSINSPPILMHSGIGPKEHLEEVGIEVVKNLRVGDNYQDHLSFPLFSVGIDHSVVFPITPYGIIREFYKYFVYRTGALAALELTNFGGYVNTDNKTSFSNIQYVHALVQQQDPYLIHEVLRSLGTGDDVSKTLKDYNQDSPFLVTLSLLLHPKSSGHVRLKNSDPFSTPVITPNFLSDKHGEDIEVLLTAIKILKKLFATKAFASSDPKLLELNIRNCREFESQSDDYWRCVIRNLAIPAYHPVGTCKMGRSSDVSAVVDPQLRVHGVKGLRVIDASVMPIIPSCNTNAPTFMIAEKGADLIRESWINKHDEL